MKVYLNKSMSVMQCMGLMVIILACFFLLPGVGHAVGGVGWSKLYSEHGTNAASSITDGQTRGEQFYSANTFNSLRVICPSYSNNIGNLTLKLYVWNTNYATTVAGAAIASQTFTNFNDNAWLQINFS
ncbi:MAG TPA: hypothetical protein VGE40_01315, partial [Bacilli bacterium]